MIMKIEPSAAMKTFGRSKKKEMVVLNFKSACMKKYFTMFFSVRPQIKNSSLVYSQSSISIKLVVSGPHCREFQPD